MEDSGVLLACLFLSVVGVGAAVIFFYDVYWKERLRQKKAAKRT